MVTGDCYQAVQGRPQAYRLVMTGGGECFAVGGKIDRDNKIGMTFEDRGWGREVGRVPQAYRFVITGGGECFAVGGKGHRENRIGMIRENGKWGGGGEVG